MNRDEEHRLAREKLDELSDRLVEHARNVIWYFDKRADEGYVLSKAEATLVKGLRQTVEEWERDCAA